MSRPGAADPEVNGTISNGISNISLNCHPKTGMDIRS